MANAIRQPAEFSSHSLWLKALFVLVCATCMLPRLSLAARAISSHNTVDFDAGPQESELHENDRPLRPDAIYSSEAGYGWAQRPSGSFLRSKLSLSRNAMTIDGVSGTHYAFRADIKPGRWCVTLWFNAERAGDDLPTILLQSRKQELGWQRFTSPAEPSTSQPKMVRVFHREVRVDSDGFSLDLDGGEHEVRLLGISLYRWPSDLQPHHRNFLAELKTLGSYNSSASLADILKQAAAARLREPEDGFYAVWHQRLQLLSEAEQYFEMRGWEQAREQTGLGMFERLYQVVMLVDGLLGDEPTLAEPLAERATYLRGRILYWLRQEGAGELELNGATRDLGKLYAKHPDDQILAMYAGKKVDLPDPCDHLEAHQAAPAWSVAQREALCRMRHIAHWWVTQRQRENGELGGKLGDDVEILRWWAPLVLVGDKTALEGWQRLADGVWNSDQTHEGYAAEVSDVEHAAEFIADTAPLMAITSDSSIYQQRLATSAKHFPELWTRITPHGHRHFRSAWFSSTVIADEPPKGRDLEYNTRAVQPLRYLAWRSESPELVALLQEWSLAWLHASLREDKGKPKGIIPASVRFSDESINGDEPTWYLANMYWKYFDWEHHAGSLMLDQLLFTYTLTSDEQLLQPMMLALELIREEESRWVNNGEKDELSPGSRGWVAAKLASSDYFWHVVEQWRFLSHDSRWDDLISQYGTPYGRYRLSGEERFLVEGLEQLLEGVRYNTPLKTTEVIHTDRVYVPGAELVKAMLTGDGMEDNLSPYYAVSWEDTNEHFTALVADAGTDRLAVDLYSHSPKQQRVAMRLWQLEPGIYQLVTSRRSVVSSQSNQPHEDSHTRRSIEVSTKGQRLWIDLPGLQEQTLQIIQKREL